MNTVDSQFVVSEATMGGDITAFVIVSRTKGFAIVRDTDFAHSLITFRSLIGRAAAERLWDRSMPSMPHLALNSRNEVYLAVIDTQLATSGLRIFDAVTDNETTFNAAQCRAVSPGVHCLCRVTDGWGMSRARQGCLSWPPLVSRVAKSQHTAFAIQLVSWYANAIRINVMLLRMRCRRYAARVLRLLLCCLF